MDLRLALVILLLLPAGASGQATLSLYEQAEVARKEGRGDEALALFSQALIEKPKDVETHLGYQKLLQSQGKEPDLIREYESLLEENAEPWSLYLLGNLLHDPAREEELYRRALAHEPPDSLLAPRLLDALASALARQLRWGEAEEVARELVALEEAGGNETWNGLWAIADIYLTTGRLQPLLDTYSRHLAEHPLDFPRLLLMADALSTSHNDSEAQIYLRRAEALDAHDDAYLAAATAFHVRAGRGALAEPYILEWLARDPHDPRALHALGVARGLLCGSPEGLQYLEEACRLEPGSSEPFTALAVLHLLLGNLRAGEDALKEALRLDRSNHVALWNMSVLCLILRRPEEALAWIQQALAVCSHESAYHSTLGKACIQLDDFARAREAFKAAAESQTQLLPLTPLAEGGARLESDVRLRAKHLNELARAFASEGELQAARIAFEEGIRGDPTYDSNYWELATLHRHLGQFDSAVEVWSDLQTVYRTEEAPAYLRNAAAKQRAGSLYDSGRREESVAAYKEILASLPVEDPDFPVLEQMVARLEGADGGLVPFRLEGLQLQEAAHWNYCVPISLGTVLSYWDVPVDVAQLGKALVVDGPSVPTSSETPALLGLV